MIVRTNSKDGVESKAVFSDCEKYRYVLSRVWDSSKGKVMFIGLNPSTATEVKNDPTVSRMIGYAKRWGYGGVIVCNAFGFRATFPKDLKNAEDPIGKENDFFLVESAREVEKVIACWGNHALFSDRSEEVKKFLQEFYCFDITKVGEPRHILYLRKDAKLQRFC